MSKTYIPDNSDAVTSQIGASLETLAATLHARRDAGEESYTYRLLNGDLDKLLKKLCEESLEVSLAAKEIQMQEAYCASDADIDTELDHLRYEAGDVVYHLLVVLERFGISIDELAAEMNSRMSEDEISVHPGMIRLQEEHINRGK